MRISYNWLKDYIDLKLPPEKVAEVLTMAGLTVESVRAAGADRILEIEVTANRPDWLSFIGVARELSAITGAKLKIPEADAGFVQEIKDEVKIKIEDGKLCPRYTARVIRDVKVQQPPAWLKDKIEAMGLRSVNNIVDITNFCLFETGEPMHAFDLDKIAGGVVRVRRAKAGEKIITIDKAERTLDDSMLVIADSVRAIAIAGVMGGLDTEVTASTKNILLEAAYFDPISVRRTSRKLGISTESSYRFERRVDPSNIAYSSDRASMLIYELCDGDLGGFVDIGDRRQIKKSAELNYGRLNKILGLEIPVTTVKKILTALGLTIKESSREKIKLEVPAFRHDLNGEIDLIEEVSRIYGYDRIPATIPEITEQPTRMPAEMAIEKIIRKVLSGLGADEIITYSLISRKLAVASGIAEEGCVEILNPLTSEQEMMRPGLITGMLGSMLWNMNRKTKDLRLFELGRVYLKKGENKFDEKRHLSIGVSGEMSNWLEGSRSVTLFDLKGMAEELFSGLGITGADFKHAQREGFERSSSASIEIGGKQVGVIGKINKKLSKDFNIKNDVYMAEICVDDVLEHVDLEKKFKNIPRYPSVLRDISILVPPDVLNSELMRLVKMSAGDILKSIKLTDRYAGKQISDGKMSLTYRLEYQDPSKTLEEKEVSRVHEAILRTLEEKFGAKLRA